MNRCGFRNCKFNQACECTQKDGGGLPYGINEEGRRKHKDQSAEIRAYCRCCSPDIGQYDLVPRLAKIAYDWDFYEFSDTCEDADDCEAQILKSLETAEGTKALIDFCDTLIDETENEHRTKVKLNKAFIKEVKDIKQILELFLKNM